MCIDVFLPYASPLYVPICFDVFLHISFSMHLYLSVCFCFYVFLALAVVCALW